ncbi:MULTISPECIES: DUF3566 domain-containing protein [Kocuria]|uniref:DUF3566 domain-containing protein n=1 Tax=Kocuria TaxID=57493 RepID=UPI000660B01B|nr:MULTISPECIES: DUF3566 domain-containing protein [Kocuria]MCT1367754.1 DUF3566 domain-containing protein [Rothia sp. p3-SID1597]RUQ20304.1 DUF3566 domain-containing protein [Kocuria sp. HSID16901]
MSTNKPGNAAGRSSAAPGSSARKPADNRRQPAAGGSSRGESVTATKKASPNGPSKAPANGPANGANRRPASSSRPLVRPAPRSKVRRAHLTVAKVDLWSIAKLVFLLSVAVGIVVVVATVILWLVFDITGIFGGVDSVLSMLSSQGNAVSITDYLSLGQVALYATILSIVNVVLMTLLGVISAFLYNIAAKLVGGIGVTLTDD